MLALAVALAAIATTAPVLAKPGDQAAPAVDNATRDRSRAAFRRGVAQLRAQDWSGARASFEEAWSLVQHPSILLNLGIARLRTDDPVLAEQDLVRFLSEDPDAAADEQASAREALAEARSRIGTLRVVVSPAIARVVVDGKPLAVRSLPAGESVAEGRLKAGEHSVVVEADGFQPDKRAAVVKPKSDTELRLTLAPEAPKPPPPSGPSTRTIVGWSLAGTAGVALVGSGILGLRAMSLADDYSDRSSSSFQRPDVKDEGVAFRTGADVALVVGVLAGAGAVVLLLTDLGSGRPSGAVARPPALLRW